MTSQNAYIWDRDRREQQKSRNVPWPKGAPPRSTVPHAGDDVGVGGIKFTVVHGIPVHYNGSQWKLQLRSATGGIVHYSLSNIDPWVEPKPVVKCWCDHDCEYCAHNCGPEYGFTPAAIEAVMLGQGHGWGSVVMVIKALREAGS